MPRSGTEPPGDCLEGWKPARDSKAADRLIGRVEDIKTFLKWNLAWAQSKMEQFANAH
jgi:hypothetical protein